ncbi:hypothetical protein DFQ28_005482 [Apophysomyces sp. BC1034]|nr:hypothetical protein DFQ28_005482 [Apophysomyces sp. BC1034]
MSSQNQNSIFKQQQRLYRLDHSLIKTRSPTYYVPPSNDLPASMSKGRKRRASEDEEMAGPSNDANVSFHFGSGLASPAFRPLMEHRALHSIKRNRTGIEKQYPITKLLGKRFSSVYFIIERS